MRVQKHGFDQVVLGDLVYSKEPHIVKETFVAECEDVNGNNMDDYSNLDETSETDLPEERNIPVKVINEEDLKSVYRDLAQKDGISLTETAHKIKEFSITNMTGAYRRVFQKPKDFEWELLSYTDGTVPLADTDLDVIAKSVKKSKVREEDSANGSEELPAESSAISVGGDMVTGKGHEEKINSESGMQSEKSHSGGNAESQMALKLSFTLPASCYATMAVRELLKTSTSVAFHKSLND
ncbi:putative F-box protein-like [Capsicum annuum]|nr:putative F-box protein-like [Capsicum annuum]